MGHFFHGYLMSVVILTYAEENFSIIPAKEKCSLTSRCFDRETVVFPAVYTSVLHKYHRKPCNGCHKKAR